MKRACRRRDDGFTLIELLISIALMVLLLAAITMVFVKTTDTVAISEARMTVYTNARYALDVLENDLMGCLSFDPPPMQQPQPGQPPPPPGQQLVFQAFWMENGYVSSPGAMPSYNVSGGHTDKAGDRMSFRATTAVGDTMQTCQVTYELIPGNMAIDPSGSVVAGDDSHRNIVRPDATGSYRGLYTLVRRVRTADPATPTIFDKIPQVRDRATGSLVSVPDTELCHYVVSFNLEYFASNYTFSQLEPSHFTSSDPLGDGKGPNDTTTPFRVPSIRATLVIVEDVGARQERMVQKAIWVPQG
jgi:prepilin-type N-terminal cleavage/methylation domain-containing protein